MKATITKYPDFQSLKEAERATNKAQNPAMPDRQEPDLMQNFIEQFSGKKGDKKVNETFLKP